MEKGFHPFHSVYYRDSTDTQYIQSLQSAVFFMRLSDCHDVMNPDGMFPCINRIQSSVASPDMKTAYFRRIFSAEFLFVTISTGPGIPFRAFECIKIILRDFFGSSLMASIDFCLTKIRKFTP